MTPKQKEEYERLAKEAVSKAGLELITIAPEEDYIETWCPDCKKTSIFRKCELGRVRCSTCYTKRRREYFNRKSEELVGAAGFDLRYASYEDDYIEAECPVCENITSFRFKELNNIVCKFCSMKKSAAENGFDLYWGADSYGEPWEEQLDEWKEDNSAEPAILVCRNCGEVHIISADTNDAIEKVRQCKCACSVITQELQQLITERGFSCEFRSCPIGYYTLNPGEVALLCNRCGEEIILSLEDEALPEKIANLHCSSDECYLEEDYIAWTRQGKMAWCYDALHVVSIIDLTTFNSLEFENGAHPAIPESSPHDVYFAVDPNDHDYAFAFVIYPEMDDEWLSKYLLFRFEIAAWGKQHGTVTVSTRWPHFYTVLYETIVRDIADGDNRDRQVVETNFNHYINAYNSMHELNNSVWSVANLLVVMEGFRDALGRMVNDPDCTKGARDPHLRQFLSLHTCPVCNKAYTSTETICLRCGFSDLNKVFVNRDEAEYWKKYTLLPYKERYKSDD